MDKEGESFKMPLAVLNTFEAKSQAGAPPDEVFQVPETWEADCKDGIKEIPMKNATKLFGFVPTAIWQCIGLPNPKYESPYAVSSLLTAHQRQAAAAAEALSAKHEKV